MRSDTKEVTINKKNTEMNFVKKNRQFFLISFDTSTTENFTGLFLQVSKISFAGFFIFVLLFQQFNVGTEASGATFSGNLIAGKDTFQNVDSIIKTKADTIRTDSLVIDTNVTKDDMLKSP